MNNETSHETTSSLAIHLSPEVIGSVFGVPLTSTMLTVWLAMAVLVGLALLIRRRLSLMPGKLQSAVELLVGGVFDYMADTLEDREIAKRYFPLVMTIFLFILTMNWLGLVPGVDSIGIYEEGTATLMPLFHPAATDLNITIAFALVAFVSIELAGVTMLGLIKYGGKFLNFKSPLGFVIGLIELLSEMARLISFSFRLFGNIFAGKVLLLVVMALATPYILPVPMMAYELFVGFIQAFIFAILTLFFIKLAIEEPH